MEIEMFKYLTLLLCFGPLVCCAQGVVLSRDGRASMPVTIAPDASDHVRESANDLADMLERIGGATFDVVASDRPTGLSLRVAPDPDRPERYTITTHDDGLRIVGASDLAVRHAVWDLLHRLGFRQYFPGDRWQILPRRDVIDIEMNIDEAPDYDSRQLWYAYNNDPWNDGPYHRWVVRNRMGGLFGLNTGHEWDAIVQRHMATFEANPNWLALVDGKRVPPGDQLEKFCVSNADLRRFVVDDTLARARANPHVDSLSLDPSDGLGWCQCEPCAAIGSPSDRVILLANEAAAALEQAGYDRMHIGVYAYAGHDEPPRVEPHPKVIVSIATAFSDHAPQHLIDGWRAAGVHQFGIREYHSVVAWDRNLPGSARGGDTQYLAQTIARFHQSGARYYTSETGDSWGPNGLGHYLTARLLWDVDEADRVDQIVARFVEDCFGDAAEQMARFYAMIDAANKPLMSSDLIGRMYRLLAEARAMTSDPAVRARLSDLALYTRYVELFFAYRQSGDPNAAIAAIQFAWRIRETGMVHTHALYVDIPHRDKQIVVPDDADWRAPEARNPWKSSEPFADGQIDAIIADGIANNELFDFTPRQFAGVLQPARLSRGDAALGDFGPHDRHEQAWLIWIDQPGSIPFGALTGIIPSYRDKRDTRFELHTIGQPIDGMVDSADVAPDGQTHDIALATPVRGMHRLTMSDAGAMTTLTFDDRTVVSREASTRSPLRLNAGARVYFYVPRGVTRIGGFAETEYPTLRPADAPADQAVAVGPGYFSVDVPPGKDGMCWRLDVASNASDIVLMTVPPFVARSPDQLILPKDATDDHGR